MKQRQIETETSIKEDLLELYKAHIMPRPQRQYRENRRGKLMSLKTKSNDNDETPMKRAKPNRLVV